MAIQIRQYKSSDYDSIAQLYNNSELYGGEFSEFRDSKDVLDKTVSKDPYAVMVAEKDGVIVGTISLIENERIAWLYRFCVAESAEKDQVAKALLERAEEMLTRRGHRQVLVYNSPNLQALHDRYIKLGFNKGNNYSCFWKDI